MHKILLKEVASLVPVWIMQRLAAEAIYRQAFQKDIKKTQRFCAREALWEYILSIFPKAPICYIEFGVYKGDSLIYFSDTNKNKSSFFGVLIHLKVCRRNGDQWKRGLLT